MLGDLFVQSMSVEEKTSPEEIPEKDQTNNVFKQSGEIVSIYLGLVLYLLDIK
jgi:hypothetical protein